METSTSFAKQQLQPPNGCRGRVHVRTRVLHRNSRGGRTLWARREYGPENEDSATPRSRSLGDLPRVCRRERQEGAGAINGSDRQRTRTTIWPMSRLRRPEAREPAALPHLPAFGGDAEKRTAGFDFIKRSILELSLS